MPTIFEPFDSKDELIAYITESVKEGDDGKFLLAEAIDKHNQYRSEIEQSKKYRSRAQDAEKERDDAKANFEAAIKERVLLEDKLKQYATLEGTSEELQKRYKEAIDRESDLKKELELAKETLLPIQNEVETLRMNENRRVIQTALRDEAVKAKVRPEAYEDVDSLIGDFEIDPVDKTIRSKKDGFRVADYLANVLEKRKHWLIPSRGTGSDSGTGASGGSREAMYAQAKANGDLDAMVKYAPIKSDGVPPLIQ